MARLKTLAPAIGVAPSLLAKTSPLRPEPQDRRNSAPWRRWYGLVRWRRMRDQALLDAMYTCVMCGVLEGDTSKLVADHIIPHRGRERLFWDQGNVQCLCASCHSSAKQREEQSEIVGIWD